ncbi:MAG: hypothetical protein B6229_01100 [Spirochaetaceae bacterium 4572_7]|nr:MAG: hypothetical protein B6229_01100 [Spirochaetaceae bacterium 4572_7]
MKKYIIVVVLFVVSFNVLFSKNSKLSEAKDILTHAQTYHFLSRAKYGDSFDIIRAGEYGEEALSLLDGIDDPKAVELRNLANIVIKEAGIRYENNFDNVVNMMPYFTLLTGEQTTYEYIDDPAVLAVTGALENSLKKLPVLKVDLQYNVIITSEPKIRGLEDELFFIFSIDSRFYPRPKEDISKILTNSEMDKLYNIKEAPIYLEKLAKNWGKRYVLHAQIVENDIVDDVYYYGVFLRLYDRDLGKYVQTSYSDGFAQNRLDTANKLKITLLALLLILLIIPFVVSLLLKHQKKHEQGRVAPLSALFSGLVGLVLSIIIIKLASAIAPEPAVLMVDPHSTLWLLGLSIVLPLIPLISSYLIGTRIKIFSEKLSSANTLAAFITGSLLGVSTFLVVLIIIRFGVSATIPFIALSIWFSIISGVTVGYGIFTWVTRENKLGIYVSLIMLIPVVAYFHQFLFYHLNSLQVIVPFITLFYIFYIIADKIIQSKGINRSSKTEEIYKTKLTIDTLKTKLHNPEYIDQDNAGEFINTRINNYLDYIKDSNSKINKSKPLYVELITGKQGAGKTRSAKEIAKAIDQEYFNQFGKHGHILFGDCDELNNDGSGVPFEPFAQAFHELLGAGRFEPTLKRVQKITSGLQRVGLDSALGAMGLGALNSLMGIGDEDQGVVTSDSEIAFTLAKTMTELSKKDDAPVILILDDMHFIDPLSLEIFEMMVTDLILSKESNKVMFILTSMDGELGEWYNKLEKLKKSDSILLVESNSSNISNPDRFEKLLVTGLGFHAKSANRIITQLNQYNPETIRHTLEAVGKLISLDALFIDKNETVRLNPDFDITLLPPPKSLKESTRNLLKELTPLQQDITECASFIGYEFNAEVLSSVLNIDRLLVLKELKTLEKLEVLYDIVDQDDVYSFYSTATAAAIRHETNASNKSDNFEIPQVVREYHYRIALALIDRMNRSEDNISTVSINELTIIAKRSYAAGDRMIKEAFLYNQVAATRMYTLARYKESDFFSRNAISCALKLKSLSDHIDILKLKNMIIKLGAILSTERGYIDEVYMDAESFYTRFKQLDGVRDLFLNTMLDYAEYILVNHLLYRKDKDLIHKLLGKLKDIKPSGLLNIRTLFMTIRLENMLDPVDKYLEELKSIENKLNNLQTDKQGYDYLRFESEIYEEIALEEFSAWNKDSLFTYVEKAIEVKKDRLVNDQEGIAKLEYIKGEAYKKLLDSIKAIEHYEIACEISLRIGASLHRVNSLLALSQLVIHTDVDRTRELLEEAVHESMLKGLYLQSYTGLKALKELSNINGYDHIWDDYDTEVSNLKDLKSDMDLSSLFKNISKL